MKLQNQSKITGKRRTPFATVPDTLRRTEILRVRVSKTEKASYEAQAALRKLDMSEYVRRCVDGRRADVRVEVDMILAVRQVANAIRGLHSEFVRQQIPPPEAELSQVLKEAVSTIISLGRY